MPLRDGAAEALQLKPSGVAGLEDTIATLVCVVAVLVINRALN
jgi:hypothetical protein